jgi:hypothetical protein
MGLSQTPLADGALVNLLVNVDAFPDTYPLQLLNMVATDPSAYYTEGGASLNSPPVPIIRHARRVAFSAAGASGCQGDPTPA